MKPVIHKRVYRIAWGMACLVEALCTYGGGYADDSWFWKDVTCKRCLKRRDKAKGPKW